MNTLRIGSYYEVPQMAYEQPPLVTWRDFYDFRNHVIRLLRVFGTAGPMGEVDRSADEDDWPCFGLESLAGGPNYPPAHDSATSSRVIISP